MKVSCWIWFKKYVLLWKFTNTGEKKSCTMDLTRNLQIGIKYKVQLTTKTNYPLNGKISEYQSFWKLHDKLISIRFGNYVHIFQK